MIDRTLLRQLQEWKADSHRKPLILRGARQVGKSTLVQQFAAEFKVFLPLNLDKAGDAQLFADNSDLQRLIDAIFLHCRKEKKQAASTLLFIDEIQNSPQAIAMLRYFYEEAPEIHVIAAGSLLESLIDTRVSFPVGRVQYLAVRPCSFLEFLNGVDDAFDAQVLSAFKGSLVHSRLLDQFNRYCIVGGMPEAIMAYAQQRDVLATNPVFETLLASYIDDVEKYARNPTMAQVIRFIIANGWQMGGQTIAFEHFANAPYKSREMGEAFRAIEKAMLLELVYPVSSSQMPLMPVFTRRPKLIWLDTGIVNYRAGIQSSVFSVKDVQDAWRGRVAEHIVAQELLALSDSVLSHRFFWTSPKRGTTPEVDFVLSWQGLCVPIEVKSGTNAHLKSLHMFMDSAPHDIAVRIWSNKFSIDHVTTASGKAFRLFNVPFYEVCILPQLLSKFA